MKVAQRVLGWDFLRGMCACAVASYHLLLWQGVTSIHTWGSYGVYIFFVLSGASLAYTYAERLSDKRFSLIDFLWVRYWRLAPLYLALMLLVLPFKLAKEGASKALIFEYLSNASFLFGFFNPSTHAVLIGGWSLGIEAIFYLLFPLLMLGFRKKGGGVLIFIILLALQTAWIYATVGSGDYSMRAESYHQIPAFAAYFMGGCLIGVQRRNATPNKHQSFGVGLLLILSGFGLMLAINPDTQGQELVGWRGAVLTAMCFLLVYLAGKIDLTGRLANISKYLGDSTYGLYLLHPIIFFGLAYFVFPRLAVPPPTDWSLHAQCILLLLILTTGFVLALFSERLFEKPVRRWSRHRLRMGKHISPHGNKNAH